MLRTLTLITAVSGLLFANASHAQETKQKTKRKTTISIDKDHMRFTSNDTTSDNPSGKECKKKEEKRFSTSFALVDLGVNLLNDNTNYADPNVRSYFHNVPNAQIGKDLFELRNGKSVNVNIYPYMLKFAAVKTGGQRIYISTGLGLQLYNFRYEKPLTYLKDPVTTMVYRGDNPSDIVMDTISFKKNKLAFDYLNVPLMFTFKTRFDKKHWLVYGFGATQGFRLASWTKQVSSARGKVKQHDNFSTADFNTCVNAEIGIEGMIRFYASYQLTSLYDNGLDQHPFCFGVRISGI